MRIWTIAVAAVLGFLVAACQAPPTKTSELQASTPLVAPIDTSLAQVTSPAFAEDYNGKRVRFTCQWRGFYQMDTLMGSKNYVPITVSANGVAAYVYIGIMKSQYDKAASLQEGQEVHMTARVLRTQGVTLLFVEAFKTVVN